MTSNAWHDPKASPLTFNVSVTSPPVTFATTPEVKDATRTAFPEEAFPDDPVSSATAHVILSVVQVGALPVVTLCGITMNVINMAVFVRQGLSDRINLCLFCLAMADTGYITISMTTRLYSIFSLADPQLGHFWQVQSLSLVGIYMGFLNWSNLLTLLISLERCVCVVWPLRAKTLLALRHMVAIILFLLVTCMSGCCLVCFKYYTVSYRDPLTHTLRYYNQPTPFYLRYRRVVDVIFDTIFNFSVQIFTLSGVAMATLIISVRMRAALNWREHSAHVAAGKMATSAEAREAAVTRMLLVVCVVYTICTIPTLMQSFARYAVRDFEPGRRYNNVFYVTISLMHLAASINSSGNFLIYWTMSTKFKDTLKDMLGSRQQKPECSTKQTDLNDITKPRC